MGVQILPISYSFWQKLAKLRVRAPWRVHAPTWGKSWIRLSFQEKNILMSYPIFYVSVVYIFGQFNNSVALLIYFVLFIQILLPKLSRTFICSGNFTNVNLPLRLFQIPDF